MKKLIVLLAAVMLMAGCASLKTAQEDFKTGATAPYEQDEVTPQQQSSQVTGVVSLIPGGGAIAGPLGLGLTTLFTWMRGRRIRKGKPTSSNPITGFLGSKVGLETIVQNVSNIVAGLAEVGADGSPLKRAWKMALAALVGLIGTAALVPGFKEALVANPTIAAVIAGGAAIFGGLEKAASTVLPVNSDPASGRPE